MPVVAAFAPEHALDRAAAEAFAAAALPTSAEEVWRYSPVDDLDLGRYAPASPPHLAGGGPAAEPAGLPAAVVEVLDAHRGEAALGLVLVDGHLTHRIALGGPGAERVEVLDARSAGALDLPEPDDAFGLLHRAFAAPVVLRVRPGATAGPVVVVHWSSGGGIAAFPHLVVDAGADAEIAVLEVLRSAPGADAFVLAVTDVLAAKAARVGHALVQDLDRAATQLAILRSSVDADATFTAAAVGMGAAWGRLRTDCRLLGRGATGNLRAAWFGEGDQHLDYRTFQEHAAPDTTSDLVYKGAVDGHSRSVYTGLIRVDEGARGTDAVQTNRNLKLSDDAWAESVPNLEIHNNDVRCAHASAVGPVDEEQRWYLESRGVPAAIADELIVGGFFDEVLRALPVAGGEPLARALLAGKLARRNR